MFGGLADYLGLFAHAPISEARADAIEQNGYKKNSQYAGESALNHDKQLLQEVK